MKRRTMTFVSLMMSAAIAVSSTGCTQLFSSVGNTYSNADQYTSGNIEYDGKQVDALDINWQDGAISVTRYDGDTVTIAETSPKELTEAQTVHTWLDGSTLRIQYSKSGEMLMGKELEKSLEIRLPKDMELKKVDVDTASTETTIEDVTAEKFDIDTASGTTKLLHCSGDSFSIDAASGDMILEQYGASDSITADTASGTITITAETVASVNMDTASGAISLSVQDAQSVEADSASGNVELHYLHIPEKTSVDTASGDVTVYVPENADFTMEVDTASGDFTADTAMKMKGDTYISGNGTNKMTIDTASGDIFVKTEK